MSSDVFATAVPDSLDEWLNWLEIRHAKPIDLGLKRITQVAHQLDIGAVLTGAEQGLQRANRPTVITVAGTNGKGSTLAALEALLSHSGSSPNKRYGKYTSPHLLSFNERVVINGATVSDSELCDAFLHVERARVAAESEQSDSLSLSYFEFTTLAAFYLFDRANLDFWLLEVGLGGRLDAVNIIDADVAVITNIDLDHQEYLGDTLDAIGREKAGVARPGKPALVADTAPPQGLLEALEQRQSEVIIVTQSELDQLSRYTPKLHPEAWWAAISAMAICDVRLSDGSRHALLSETDFTGRLQNAHFQDRDLLLDVAHNIASVRRLCNELRSITDAGQKVIAIMGAMADKPIAQMLSLMDECVDEWLFVDLDTPRAATADALASRLVECTTNAEGRFKVYNNMKTALNSAVQSSVPADRIVVFGSFYTVAAALEIIQAP